MNTFFSIKNSRQTTDQDSEILELNSATQYLCAVKNKGTSVVERYMSDKILPSHGGQEFGKTLR